MNRTAIVWLRVLFGILCIPAVFLLLLSPFVFDNPSASSSVLAWNFAFSPLIYIALFVVSLLGKGTLSNSGAAPRAATVRALLPLAGIAWYGLAIALLQVICGGDFSCK